MHGVINFLKPPGMTSHDAVSFVRRVVGTKRVGHTGTLDPSAAGVLPICVGQATRLVEYLQAGRKTYIAEVTFGYETDTLDAMGNVVYEDENNASDVNLERLRLSLDGFRGKILQAPPIFSAIKKDGKKLYELAREGVDETTLDIEARQVEIHGLVVTRFFDASTRSDNRPRALLRVECGSGTYIRSLVRDIGRDLGCGATMTFLVRTQNGAFEIENSHTTESVERDFAIALLPMKQVLRWCARVLIEDDEAVERLAKGQEAQAITISKALMNERKSDSDKSKELRTQAFFHGVGIESSRAAFAHSNGTMLALANFDGHVYKPEKVFFLNRDE